MTVRSDATMETISSKENIWYELRLYTTSEPAEALAEYFLSRGAFGVATYDPYTLRRLLEDPQQDIFIDDYGILDEEVKIQAYFSGTERTIRIAPYLGESANPFHYLEQMLYAQFQTEEIPIEEFLREVHAKLAEMSTYFEMGETRLAWEKVQEEDWANSWKQHYHPIEISDKLLICPSWERQICKEGQHLILLDPGSAFGTGSHETTAMCMKLMEKYLPKKAKVLDLGCGSGILSITAEKLGASSILALDLDPQAIRVTEENLVKNTCSKIVAQQGTLHSKAKSTHQASVMHETSFDFIVANILAEVLCRLKIALLEHTKSNGYLLLSGIINTKEKMVRETFEESSDLLLLERREEKDWVALLYKVK